MRHRWLFAWVVVPALVGLPALGGPPGKPLDFPGFKVANGLLDKDGLPAGGASVCLLDRPVCYKMPDWIDRDTGKALYQFGLDPKVERVKPRNGGSLVFFSARYSGGGSGVADRLAVLRYEGDGRIVNLLPDHYVTGQSDRAMWNLPKVSDFPLLFTADPYWDLDGGETHFAWHRYDVEVFRFDAKSDMYVKVLSYRTAKKYAGLDEVSVISVLGPEQDEIMRRLRTLRQ